MEALRLDRAAALAGAGSALAVAPATQGMVAFTAAAIALGLGCGALVLPGHRPALVPALVLLFVGVILLWSYGAYLTIVLVLWLSAAMPDALAGVLASGPFVGLFALLQRAFRPGSRAAT